MSEPKVHEHRVTWSSTPFCADCGEIVATFRAAAKAVNHHGLNKRKAPK